MGDCRRSLADWALLIQGMRGVGVVNGHLIASHHAPRIIKTTSSIDQAQSPIAYETEIRCTCHCEFIGEEWREC
jgi:hypothetical protein